MLYPRHVIDTVKTVREEDKVVQFKITLWNERLDKMEVIYRYTPMRPDDIPEKQEVVDIVEEVIPTEDPILEEVEDGNTELREATSEE